MANSNHKRRNYTLALLSASGFIGLMLHGVTEAGPKAQKAVCAWEWVSPKPLQMCHPKSEPPSQEQPTSVKPPA
jgi:hypothetical protein